MYVVPAVVVALVVVLVAVWLYLRHRNGKNESLWKVQRDELIFADPPETIGNGTFGLVVLAEYRGTQVAVKKVMPAPPSSSNSPSQEQFSMNCPSSSSSYESPSERPSPHAETTVHSTIDNKAGCSSWSGKELRMCTKAAGASSCHDHSGTSRGAFDLWKRRAKLQAAKTDFIREMGQMAKLRHPWYVTNFVLFLKCIFLVELTSNHRLLSRTALLLSWVQFSQMILFSLWSTCNMDHFMTSSTTKPWF